MQLFFSGTLLILGMSYGNFNEGICLKSHFKTCWRLGQQAAVGTRVWQAAGLGPEPPEGRLPWEAHSVQGALQAPGRGGDCQLGSRNGRAHTHRQRQALCGTVTRGVMFAPTMENTGSLRLPDAVLLHAELLEEDALGEAIPLAPLLQRLSLSPVSLGGHTVPRSMSLGTRVSVSVGPSTCLCILVGVSVRGCVRGACLSGLAHVLGLGAAPVLV